MDGFLGKVWDIIAFLCNTAVDHPKGALITICVVAGTFGLMILIRNIRHSVKKHDDRDPQRAFNRAQKDLMLSRCGARCEHVNMLGFRCSVKNTIESPLQADHHYPWSRVKVSNRDRDVISTISPVSDERPGSTSVSNLVALCGRHNRKKTNNWPGWFSTSMLSWKRKGYFPRGTETRPGIK